MQLNNHTDLQALKNIDVRTVDPCTLVDIEDIMIDRKLPQEDRLTDFVRQIRNPYCYKCGEAIVKISFSDTGVTLEDRLEHYLNTFTV